MALLSGSLASLINGVSQQPPWMRLPSQAEAQENAISSLVDGVKRRPPTEHIARLSATSFGDCTVHSINRDAAHRFQVVVTDGDIAIFDLEGTEQTIAFPNGKAYLAAVDPVRSFTLTTIADFSFVVNREKIVSETNAGNSITNWMYLYVKQAFYNCNYACYVDGTLLTFVSTVATGDQPTTDGISGGLATNIGAALGAGWTVEQYNSVIRFKKDDNSIHTVGASDSQGNVGLIAFGRSIQNFVDLPPHGAPDGTTVEISGTAANAFDGYWVSYDVSRNAWVETVKPEDEAGPTPTTMPWKLTQEIDGTWTFDKISWGERTCGDTNTAPSPSLIGRTINDIIVHRNRLFLLADQNVLSSRPGGSNFFKLYPSTVTTTLDTDPIDVGLSSDIDTVPIAKFAVAFAEDLLIWTAPAQFKLGTGDQTLTSGTVKATQIASYTTSLSAKPAVNGKLLHFAVEKGEDSGLREGFIDNRSLVFDATDVTVHVPSYIKGSITRLCSAINRDTLFVLADGLRNVVWVYKWYVENDTKLQSSWSKWLLDEGDTILDMSYMDSSVYFVIERETGVFLERVRLDESYTDPGLEFSVRLDRKTSPDAGIYDADADQTTWAFPYTVDIGDIVGVFGNDFIVKPGFQMPEGFVLVSEDVPAGTMVIGLAGDHSDGPCHFGIRYSTLYTLSTLTVSVPSPDGRGRQPITDGRLQLRDIFINYGYTGFFQVDTSSPGRATFTYTFQPNKLGQNLVIGVRALQSGRFRVPVRARNTEATTTIYSDSHYPCNILSVDWEGEFIVRSRRT